MTDQPNRTEQGVSPHDDRRRRVILRQARASFISAGFTATRMEPLARESNVSTATLYSFFKSKSVLFEAVILDVADEFARRMEQVRASSGPAREQLTEFMTTYAEFVGDPFVRSVFRLILAERPRVHDLAMAFFERGRSGFGAPLIRALSDLHTAGELVVHKPSWAAGQLMGMIEHPMFFLPMVAGDSGTVERETDHIVADCVETFMARYGRRAVPA